MKPIHERNLTHPERADLYEKLISTNPEITRKGDTIPYTSLNGNMFTYLSKNGSMSMRLPKNQRGEFIKKYKTALHEAHGIIQKEYVTVPDSLLGKTNELSKYLAISYDYAKTLKPKPTTRKRAR